MKLWFEKSRMAWDILLGTIMAEIKGKNGVNKKNNKVLFSNLIEEIQFIHSFIVSVIHSTSPVNTRWTHIMSWGQYLYFWFVWISCLIFLPLWHSTILKTFKISNRKISRSKKQCHVKFNVQKRIFLFQPERNGKGIASQSDWKFSRTGSSDRISLLRLRWQHEPLLFWLGYYSDN